MSATIWTPLEEGIPSSIWSPGGPAVPGEEVPEGCDLAAQAELVPGEGVLAGNVDRILFLDNFTGTNESLIADHTPDIYLSGWSSVAQALHLYNGSVTIPVTDNSSLYRSTAIGNQSAETGTGVTVGANIGFFTDLTASMSVTFETYDPGTDNITRITLTCAQNSEGVCTLQVGWAITGTDYVSSELISLTHCSWNNITVETFLNSNGTIRVNGEAVAELVLDTGFTVWDQSNPPSIKVQMDNVEANGVRVAAIYILDELGA